MEILNLYLCFYIVVFPLFQDNKGPILINNVLMRVREGDLIPITSDHLKAFDADSPDKWTHVYSHSAQWESSKWSVWSYGSVTSDLTWPDLNAADLT